MFTHPRRRPARACAALGCAWAVALPAAAAPGRHYDGILHVESSGVAPESVTAAPGDAPAPAVTDDDEIIEDALEPLPALDWRDVPEGEVASRRIRGGALLLASGGLLVIGAGILGGTDPCRRLAGNGCQSEARTRATLTMGVPGAVVLVGGAILLGFGLRARQRVRADLHADGTGGGVVLRGRF